MSKPTKHTSPPPAKKKSVTEFSAATYIGRNLLIVVGIAFLFFVIDKRNEKQSKLQDLYQEFSQLRQSNGNQSRLQEVYNEIIEIQSDTSFLTRTTRGYHWAIHELAMKNLESIEGIKEEIHRRGLDSTKQSLLDAKLSMKVGVYPFIQYIRSNTPEDAVILLPEGDSAVSNNSKWNFIYDPEWMEYFIYPRLCLTIGREDEHPDLAKKITHVLIIEGKGYDKLKYHVPENERPAEAVLPINQAPANLKTNP